MDERARRSLLNFAVLIVVAAATTIFVLSKAREAVEEIERLQSAPAYLGARQPVD